MGRKRGRSRDSQRVSDSVSLLINEVSAHLIE